MIERLLIVLAAGCVLLILAALIRAAARRRLTAVTGHHLAPALSERVSKEAPSIVYFYGPACGTCRVQATILDDLVKEGVPVVRLDASRNPQLADALSVMTVPATIVVEAGRVRAANLGLQSRDVLLRQLSTSQRR